MDYSTVVAVTNLVITAITVGLLGMILWDMFR